MRTRTIPLLIRIDDHRYRIALYPAAEDRIRAITWEVDSPEELRTLADRVRAEGIDVEWAPEADPPESRNAVASFRFLDADGFPNEICFGPTIDHEPSGPAVSSADSSPENWASDTSC